MAIAETIAQECLAARTHCVLFDHPNRGVIEVRGQDRVPFLHNVLSNDIKSLSPGEGAPACLLNAQAKIIAYMNVLCFDEFLWLALDYVLKDKLLEALGKLIIMEQVELVDRSDELKLISIHGPKAKALLESIWKTEIPTELLSHKRINAPPSPYPLPPSARGRIRHLCGGLGGEEKGEGGKITVIRINLTGETGFGFLIPKGETISLGLKPIQPATLETLRIEAGIPRYGIDFDESYIPLEAGLEKAVSFTKGCFPGQEILARLDSRGGVNKKLMGLTLEGNVLPKKGDLITKDGHEVGYITSAVFSPTLKKIIALGYLKKEYWEFETSFAIETENGQIPAQIEPLPFYTTSTQQRN